MIALKIKDTGEYIGSLSEAQLQYLIDELVEEHSEDQDYWLNRAQVEIFKEKDADPSLIALLESALGNDDEVEVIWEKS
jgi:hypothetical protein